MTAVTYLHPSACATCEGMGPGEGAASNETLDSSLFQWSLRGFESLPMEPSSPAPPLHESGTLGRPLGMAALWPHTAAVALARWIKNATKQLKDPRKIGTIAIAVAALTAALKNTKANKLKMVDASLAHLMANIEAGKVAKAVLTANAVSYFCKGPESAVYTATILPTNVHFLVKMLHRNGVDFTARGPSAWRGGIMILVPFAYLALCGWMMYRLTHDTSFKGGEEVEKAGEATLGEQEKNAVTFADIGGIPHVKEQVAEVLDFYYNRGRWQALGARRPRGILLAGPPGTGKTLLAKAVAHSAGVPFLHCAGSDFVEVFVGRGAGRVRQIFELASSRAPCVLFIDELDALGGRRSDSSRAVNEEHDQTLNQLLAAMDGISSCSDVLILGATNRFTALDPALVRPGRFDRVLQLPLPDITGREQILRVHSRRSPIADVDDTLSFVASATDGFSGAELENLVNEAAIRAVRRRKQVVERQDFQLALSDYRSSRSFSEQTSDSNPNDYPSQLAASMNLLFQAVQNAQQQVSSDPGNSTIGSVD